MTIYGIKELPKTNRVSSENIENLPLPIFNGSLSVSMSFEGHPSGSLNIEGISETEIALYRREYNQIGRKILLFKSIYLEIASYSETEDNIYVESTDKIRSFNISINFKGGHEIRSNVSIDLRNPLGFNTLGLSSSKQTTALRSLTSGVGTPLSKGFSPNLAINGRINAAALGRVTGVPYSGYTFDKIIPTSQATVKQNFSSLVQERLRLNLQIIDWINSTVRTYHYLKGTRHKISSQDINYSVDSSIQIPSEYIDCTLSGRDGLPFIGRDVQQRLTLNEKFQKDPPKKNPVKLTIFEGDDNPTKPPLDVKGLRNLDMNFDFSGPRKTLKKTTTLNGQPFEEEIFTYGFAYLGQQIRNYVAESNNATATTPALKSNAPSAFWTQIEYQKTQHIYKSASVNASVTGKDERGYIVPAKILGDSSFNTKYLTEIRTTGWKLCRFKQEEFDDSGSNQDSLDSRWLHDEIEALSNKSNLTKDEKLDLNYAKEQWKSIQFNKSAFVSRNQYVLYPVTSIYSNVEQAPFQTELIEKTELGQADPGKVLIAKPDPNYKFPMKVLEEYSMSQSFRQMDDPQNIYIREERQQVIENTEKTWEQKRQDLKELKLLPWLSTGEDTYRSTIRQVIPSKNTKGEFGYDRDKETDMYVEYEKNVSHQDHNFRYSLQEGVFRTIVGQLPDATTFQEEYKDETPSSAFDPRNFEYRIRSTTDWTKPSFTESLQYETDSLEEALLAAKAELELNNFISGSEISLNLAWFYPDIRPSDYIEIIDDISKKNLRVKSVSFQITYQGIVEGEVLKTCSGTSVTCGFMNPRQVDYTLVKTGGQPNNSDIDVHISGAKTLGSPIYPEIQTRRNVLDILEE